MKTILFGKKTDNQSMESVQHIVDLVYRESEKVYVCEKFHRAVVSDLRFPQKINLIQEISELTESVDFLISMGGDGTFLDAASLVKFSDIPILGINTGRLGFLSSVNVKDAENALSALKNKSYKLQKRMLLQLNPDLFGKEIYALNDICIQRVSESASMISIDVAVDDKHLNTYWCDGLIIATPTGSTAYSLSCGGPIAVPDSEVFLLTPIAPHSLTVRPIIIPSHCKIDVKVKGRNNKFLLAVDSALSTMETDKNITIRKSDTYVNIVLLKNQNFFKTISQKLMWGIDRRG
ncbi:MAG: NAD kinase [Lentimicrobiaceae bacterium]|nr:NAD kinase [Lentimicrobiaceae bacterium]